MVVAFLLRAALFRNRRHYVQVWEADGERHVNSLFSAGERLISYLTSIGALDGHGRVGRSRMRPEDVDPVVNRLVDASFDYEEAVDVLVYHFSEDHFSPDQYELFLSHPKALPGELPEISMMEVAELLVALEALGYIRRIAQGFLVTTKMLPAMRRAQIQYYLTALE